MGPIGDVYVEPETPFRVSALVRWSFCLFLPSMSKPYQDDARRRMKVSCATEWEFVVQTIAISTHLLVRSLPEGDLLRELDDDEPLDARIGMDLIPPTRKNLELDAVYAPMTGPIAPRAADIVRTASRTDDVGPLRRLIEETTPGGFERDPDDRILRGRLATVRAAEDALRAVAWKRHMYLMDDDPDTTGTLSMVANTIDRVLAGSEWDRSTIDAQAAQIAIEGF